MSTTDESASNSTKEPARLSLYIITPLLSVLVSLLLAEFALALVYPSPYSMERNMYFEPDPYTGYRIRPDSEGGYYNDISANANSMGLRDREFSMQKEPGITRVMVLGDSFTVGANVEESEAYPKELERLLNEGAASNYEVINTGVGGWSPYQYAQYYEYRGRKLDPDLIIVGLFVGNDTYVERFSQDDVLTAVKGRRTSQQAANKPLTKLKVTFYEHSHLARLIMNIGVPTNENFRRAESCDEFSNTYIHIQRSRMPNHLLRTPETDELARKNIEEIVRIKSMADEDGDQLLVVLIPDENQINPDLQARIIEPQDMNNYDFNQPQQLLTSLLEDNSIEVLDLKPYFSADDRCLYMNDTHWIPEGHTLAAEKIVERLAR